MYLNQKAVWSSVVVPAVKNPYGDIINEDTQSYNIGAASYTFPQGNNVSNPARMSFNNEGFNGFDISENTEHFLADLTGNHLLYSEEGYPGFASKQLSDAEGNCNIECTCVIHNTKPSTFVIDFDETRKSYPTNITISYVINGVRSAPMIINNNNSPKVRVKVDLPETFYETIIFLVNITKWNKANSNIFITNIGCIADISGKFINVRRQEHRKEVRTKDGAIHMTNYIYYTNADVHEDDRLDGNLVVNVYDMRTLSGRNRLRRLLTI